MTLDSKDTQKQGEEAQLPLKNMTFSSIFAEFYVTGRLQEQFFARQNLYLGNKS